MAILAVLMLMIRPSLVQIISFTLIILRKKEMGIILERKIMFASSFILDSNPINCL